MAGTPLAHPHHRAQQTGASLDAAPRGHAGLSSLRSFSSCPDTSSHVRLFKSWERRCSRTLTRRRCRIQTRSTEEGGAGNQGRRAQHAQSAQTSGKAPHPPDPIQPMGRVEGGTHGARTSLPARPAAAWPFPTGDRPSAPDGGARAMAAARKALPQALKGTESPPNCASTRALQGAPCSAACSLDRTLSSPYRGPAPPRAGHEGEGMGDVPSEISEVRGASSLRPQP